MHLSDGSLAQSANIIQFRFPLQLQVTVQFPIFSFILFYCLIFFRGWDLWTVSLKVICCCPSLAFRRRAFCKANERRPIAIPSSRTRLYRHRIQGNNEQSSGSQTISDKLHHAFAYFRQFVFVRAKRIETNAISAQRLRRLSQKSATQKCKSSASSSKLFYTFAKNILT